MTHSQISIFELLKILINIVSRRNFFKIKSDSKVYIFALRYTPISLYDVVTTVDMHCTSIAEET